MKKLLILLLVLLVSCTPPVGTRGTVCDKEYHPARSWVEIRMNFDSDGDFIGVTPIPHNDPEQFILYLCYTSENGKSHKTSISTYETLWHETQVGARFESTETGIIINFLKGLLNVFM